MTTTAAGVIVSISDAYDSGNIEFVRTTTTQEESSNGRRLTVTVRIKPDVYTELEKIAHMQYFSFRTKVIQSQLISDIYFMLLVRI